jgi:DNA topoisomerase-2
MDVNHSDDEQGPSVQREESAPKGKKKTASETYTKVRRVNIDIWTRIHFVLQLSQIEHILKRPDSYIGSVETITQVMWTFESDTKRMVHREVKYVPGFFKIVDEILVNAADNKVRFDGHAFVFPVTHLFEDQRQKYGHAESQH